MNKANVYFVKDRDFFLQILDYITKFLDSVEITISEKELIFKGIDPHDYCYVKATFPSTFFGMEKGIVGQNKFDIPYINNYLMDVSILNKVLLQLRKSDQVFVVFSEEEFIIQGITSKIDTVYRIKWQNIPDPILPKPKKRNYKVIIEFTPNDLITAIKQVYSISNTMKIIVTEKELTFKATHKSYSVDTKLKPKFLKNESIEEITTVSKYFKIISPAIKLSNSVKLSLMEKEPPKIELIHELGGKFEFYFSYKKDKPKKSREGFSLPLIKTSNFIEFLSVLNKSPDKSLPIHTLTTMKLETKGGDNIRFGKMLELLKKKRGVIELSEEGIIFGDELDNSIESAKIIFYNLIIEKNDFFKYFFEIVNDGFPKDKNQVRIELNLQLSEVDLPGIDKRDLATLINVGQWCNKIKYENGLISSLN